MYDIVFENYFIIYFKLLYDEYRYKVIQIDSCFWIENSYDYLEKLLLTSNDIVGANLQYDIYSTDDSSSSSHSLILQPIILSIITNLQYSRFFDSTTHKFRFIFI